MNRKALTSGVLILLALLLVVGLVVQFTPNVSSLFSSAPKGTPAVKVNDQTITVEDLQNLQRNNQVLSATTQGVLGDDLKTVTVASRIQNALLKSASKGQNISRAEVNAKVDEFRKSRNLAENKAWTDALAQANYTDASFRQEYKTSLQIQQQQKAIADAAPKATDAQTKQFYDLNPEQFQNDPRIVGREIVVSDKAKADALLGQLKAGADFSTLASQNSTVFKERGGALGAVSNGKPAPVLAAVLPTSVSAAAFALTNGGLTDVIAAEGKYYIVKVESYLPPTTKPFDQVKTQVADIVNKGLQSAALETWYDNLRKSAKIEFVSDAWKIQDPTVAVVGGQTIPYSEVLTGMVGSQQFQALVQQQQVPLEQAGTLLNQFLKPGLTEQLIEQYAAPSIVKKNNLALVGNRALLAQQLAEYGSRDAVVSDQDVIKAYQSNIANYTTKGSATVSEAVFNNKQQALDFRQSVDGQNFIKAASKAGGTVSERGTVTEGDPNSKLSPALSKAIFETSSLKAAGSGSVSDVIEQGGQYSVAYVTDLTRPNVKPLSEVRATLHDQLLAQKRAEEGQAYLKAQLKDVKVTNNLSTVLAAQEKRLAAAPKTPAVPETAPGAAAPATTPAPAPGSSAPQTQPANP